MPIVALSNQDPMETIASSQGLHALWFCPNSVKQKHAAAAFGHGRHACLAHAIVMCSVMHMHIGCCCCSSGDSSLTGVTKKHQDRNDRNILISLCCRAEADVMQLTSLLDCTPFVCLQQKYCIYAMILTLGGAAAALSAAGLPCFGRSAVWG